MENNNFFQKFLNIIITILFSIMVFSTILQVVFRYFLKYPLGWTEELSKIMFIWSSFLSLSILSKKNMLIKVEAILDYIPKIKIFIIFFTNIVSSLFIFWLAFLGFRLLDLSKTQFSPALNLPYWLIYLSLPTGLILSGYFMISNLIKIIKSNLK